MKKKLLVDINVILDVALRRTPWVVEATRLLAEIERGRADGYVAGHTITTIYCIVNAKRDAATARARVMDVLRIMHVVPLEHVDFQQALILDLKDFEDTVQAAAGLKVGADYIVTRNEEDFKGVSIAAVPPGMVLAQLKAEE
jgi:predicted nucleic acid-binding protein